VAYITQTDAQAWAEGTKLSLGNLEGGLVSQIATQTLSRVAPAYDVSGWTDSSTTPSLIRSIMAMTYIAWIYNKTYSEDDGGSPYASQLLAMADSLLEGIIDGTVDLTEVPTAATSAQGSASFYPNDLSSAQVPTSDDPSLGGAKFSFGSIF
jgi:hypothetical protein